MAALWRQLTQSAGIALDRRQEALLNQYLVLLFQANAHMNLTRITDHAQAEVQHIGDALTLLPLLKSGPMKLADIGSGGGVPGIPLAIVRPDAEVLLIESTKKKAAFLRTAVEQLGLSNVGISDHRVEDLAHDAEFREQFDVAVARAVATLDWLIEWCLPLVRKGGRLLAMKGPKVHEELPRTAKALKLTGGGPPRVHAIELPGAEHHLIVEVSKISASDPRLPRPPSLAKGRLLG